MSGAAIVMLKPDVRILATPLLPTTVPAMAVRTQPEAHDLCTSFVHGVPTLAY
jgi:hypothetical protein